MANAQRMESLKNLTPRGAVQAWLDGDFGMNEESALCFAIRKDARIALSDDEITDIVIDSMGDNCDAVECLERLARPPRNPPPR